MTGDETRGPESEPEGDDEDFATGTHYAKLYASILESSVWEEGPAVRLVWITMLVMCDRTGFVEGSDPGICRRANVSKTEGLAALRILSEPDLESKSKTWGGRRIERVAGGWKILNYEKYRDAQTPKQKATAERVARWRAKKAAEVEWRKVHEGQELPADWEENWERYVTLGNGHEPPTVAVTGTIASPPPPPPSAAGVVENSVEGVENLTGPEARTLAALETDLDREAFVAILEASGNRYAWAAECWARLQGMHPPMLTPRQLGEALRDYWGNGKTGDPSFKHFRAYLARPDRGGDGGTLGDGGSGPTGGSGPKAPRSRGGPRRPTGTPQSQNYGTPTNSEEDIKWQK